MSSTSCGASAAMSTETAIPNAIESPTACAPPPPARAPRPRGPGRGEGEKGEGPPEDRERNPERGELRPAEMTDDRGVHEEGEGLGRQAGPPPGGGTGPPPAAAR